MCQQHGYKNLITYNKRKENNKGIVEHKNYRLCQKGSLAKKMKKDKNILFTVNLLSIKDLQSVRSMDASSGFQVEQWLEDNSEYAWGIFKNGTDELIGYCTIGYADDVGDTIERHPEHTNDSLLLSDVYIDSQFRNKGYGIKLITEVIHNRWELDGDKNTVYLIAMYDKLKYFYEKIGFKPINDSEGKFHGAMVLSC